MPKPVCVPCQRFFRPMKSGFSLIEGRPKFNGVQPGKEEPENWLPYKLWQGDKYKCQGCGHEIVVGFGKQPISEHYKDNFETIVRIFKADYQVNDC